MRIERGGKCLQLRNYVEDPMEDLYRDKEIQVLLQGLYEEFSQGKSEISVSAPSYKQGQVDVLVARGLVKKLDASTLSGWGYILRPTHEGETFFKRLDEKKKENRKHTITETVKWLIPTIISIIALIVSILK